MGKGWGTSALDPHLPALGFLRAGLWPEALPTASSLPPFLSAGTRPASPQLLLLPPCFPLPRHLPQESLVFLTRSWPLSVRGPELRQWAVAGDRGWGSAGVGAVSTVGVTWCGKGTAHPGDEALPEDLAEVSSRGPAGPRGRRGLQE